MELQLELNSKYAQVFDKSKRSVVASGTVAITPPIDEDYWVYRVRLSETQAVVAFPKFFTLGIGFAQEEDWNTNLPYACETEEIFQHIQRNKGDKKIADDDVRRAIDMLRAEIEKNLTWEEIRQLG